MTNTAHTSNDVFTLARAVRDDNLDAVVLAWPARRYEALVSACAAIAAVCSKGDRRYMIRVLGEACITVGERIDGARLANVRIGNERRMAAIDRAQTELVKPDCAPEWR